MPRDGAIIFGDLIGKLDVLNVACEKCERAGRYRLDRLIQDRGRDAKILDWLGEITVTCPKKAVNNWSDQCAARCPDLAALLWRTRYQNVPAIMPPHRSRQSQRHNRMPRIPKDAARGTHQRVPSIAA